MAEIKLSELRPAGSELLQDSESFLTELSDRELDNVVGGHNQSHFTIYIKPFTNIEPITFGPLPTTNSAVIQLTD